MVEWGLGEGGGGGGGGGRVGGGGGPTMSAVLGALPLVALAGCPEPEAYWPRPFAGGLHAPQQIHIAATADDRAMAVTWSTEQPTTGSAVRFQLQPGSSAAAPCDLGAASSVGAEHDELFDNGMYTDLRNISGRNTCQNCSRRLTVIHHATMSPLLPGRRYCYQVGSREGGFSRPYNFTASDSSPRPTTLAVLGDAGEVFPRSLSDCSAQTRG
eukprot:COSAG04_NODE_1573_length_6283_cov_3.394405_5_plen_213_part_00